MAMATFQERDGRIRAIVRRKGHPVQSKTFERKSDAVRWARKLESSIDDGWQSQSKETVAELLKKYRNEVSVDKPGWKWETTRIDKFLREPWTQQPAAQASDAISQWAEAQRKKVSNATINRELNVLSGVFTFAIKRWRIKLHQNPVKSVARPPKTKARKRRVLARELKAFWGIERGRDYTIRWYLPIMVEFAIETAMRLGELVALQWHDVHEDWVYVRQSKNGDDRQVPMSDRAVELLKLLPKERGGVFPVNAGSFGAAFREVCKELGLVDLHFHDTRHEAVSRLAGVFPILQLAAVIGHRDLKSLQVYYNPTVQELAQHMRGAVQPKPPHPSPTT
jgi:integrase